MSDMPLFETLADLEIKALKAKLIEKNKRIAELEKELELADKSLTIANECLTIAYMQGYSDYKAKQIGGEE